MDNAEAVARLTDVDHSDSKGNNGGRSTKVPLDAQTILDGAYNKLVQSGKVKAGMFYEKQVPLQWTKIVNKLGVRMRERALCIVCLWRRGAG